MIVYFWFTLFLEYSALRSQSKKSGLSAKSYLPQRALKSKLCPPGPMKVPKFFTTQLSLANQQWPQGKKHPQMSGLPLMASLSSGSWFSKLPCKFSDNFKHFFSLLICQLICLDFLVILNRRMAELFWNKLVSLTRSGILHILQ